MFKFETNWFSIVATWVQSIEKYHGIFFCKSVGKNALPEVKWIHFKNILCYILIYTLDQFSPNKLNRCFFSNPKENTLDKPTRNSILLLVYNTFGWITLQSTKLCNFVVHTFYFWDFTVCFSIRKIINILIHKLYINI